MLYNCLEWYKWVLTNLYHERQLYNTLIPPSHESPAVGLRISRLNGPVELILRYTTPDMHCRHRRHECDGGIMRYRKCRVLQFGGSEMVQATRYINIEHWRIIEWYRLQAGGRADATRRARNPELVEFGHHYCTLWHWTIDIKLWLLEKVRNGSHVALSQHLLSFLFFFQLCAEDEHLIIAHGLLGLTRVDVIHKRSFSLSKARIPRRRHRRQHPREDRRENYGVSFSLPQE